MEKANLSRLTEGSLFNIGEESYTSSVDKAYEDKNIDQLNSSANHMFDSNFDQRDDEDSLQPQFGFTFGENYSLIVDQQHLSYSLEAEMDF